MKFLKTSVILVSLIGILYWYFVGSLVEINNLEDWCRYSIATDKSSYTLNKGKIKSDIVNVWKKSLNASIFANDAADDKVSEELKRLKMLNVENIDDELVIQYNFDHASLKEWSERLKSDLALDHQEILSKIYSTGDIKEVAKTCVNFGTDLWFKSVRIVKGDQSTTIKTNKYHLIKKYNKSH